jgi:hypothetical protein
MVHWILLATTPKRTPAQDMQWIEEKPTPVAYPRIQSPNTFLHAPDLRSTYCDEMPKNIPVSSALSAGSSCKSTCWSALRQVAVLRLKTTVAECLLLTDCSNTGDGGVWFLSSYSNYVIRGVNINFSPGRGRRVWMCVMRLCQGLFIPHPTTI